MLWKKLKFKTVSLITAVALTVSFCLGAYAVFPFKYKSEILRVCNETAVSPSLVLAIIKAESSFCKDKISPKGAVGLMQLLPSTANYLSEIYFGGKGFNLTNAKENILLGVTYLVYLTEKFQNENTVIASYNAGEGNVSLWLENKALSKDGKSLDKIPFKETENYLKKVLRFKKIYEVLYGCR